MRVSDGVRYGLLGAVALTAWRNQREYKVPTAAEIPDVAIHHLETPCAFTANGAKGAGEGGTIGAPAAVLNAVNDALRDTGVELEGIFA